MHPAPPHHQHQHDEVVAVAEECNIQDYCIAWNESLGFGVNGSVVRARHVHSKDEVAVKILRDKPQHRNEVRMQQLCQQLGGHSVRIVATSTGFGYHPKGQEYCRLLYVMMEVVEAAGAHTGDLFDLVKDCGRLEEHLCKQVARSLAHTLNCMHGNNIIHGDVKLENVLVAGVTRNQIEVKLADFGFASELPVRVGQSPPHTPGYASPEIVHALRGYQATGAGQEYGPEVDMWALGVLLYTLLAGTMPFSGLELSDKLQRQILIGRPAYTRSIWRDMPGAERVVRGLLDRDPLTRLTAAQLLGDDWLLA